MDFILNIISAVTGIVCAASIICSLTPTPKDDQMIGKLYKLVEIAALNIGKAKEGSTTNPIRFVKRSD